MVAAANVRGTAIKIGNLPGTRSISAGAQLDATAARLRKAEASGDAIEILASMQAATALELPQGVNLSPEVVDAMRDLRRLINSDPVMQWTCSMAQRGWYLHLRLGGISLVFAWYLLVFASGGGTAMLSFNVKANDEINKTSIESYTRT